jgi:pSer/pThr/pTyr-binding forkhead associated (FHA) protein
VEILWDGAKAQITDLGSTNGTRLDGQRITTSLLAPDNVIEIGRTRILFRVLPEAGRA